MIVLIVPYLMKYWLEMNGALLMETPLLVIFVVTSYRTISVHITSYKCSHCLELISLVAQPNFKNITGF